jgi:dGTPase
LSIEELLEVPFVRIAWAAVRARYAELGEDRLTSELVRDQIGIMANDLLGETARRIAEAGVGIVEDVRGAGRALVGFSPELAAQERQLKAFLYARMYNSPRVAAVNAEAQRVVANLYAAYRDDPRRLPAGWADWATDETERLRAIGDYVAGMTDRYAIARHRELVGPVELPEGF